MSSSTSGTTKKDHAWRWTKPIPGELKYFLCAFCDQRNTGGIFRFKQHLVGTHKGIKPCNKVPPNVKDWCTIALKRNDEEKRARIAVHREIGGLESLEEDDADDHEMTNVAASESGSAQTPLGGGSTGQPKARGPMDKFVS
ncbi:hypothetical protein RchiOBHm_Chr1g0361961 [Rosa chinensis]|uniref:Transcription factor/ chromatin remodeling BED-type(Zn) family n=1 Tax=Rosa chinensis TaxID=74649 RepID=A0A2P6SJ16_ROSCH|nr:hypothetical protein RchiOBHm_Chr1g0361961 [Rosa chinensis]